MQSSAAVGLVIHLDAEVTWHAHLKVSAQAEVSIKSSPTGGHSDDKARHKNAPKHSDRDAQAHSKRLRNTHGSGDPVKKG